MPKISFNLHFPTDKPNSSGCVFSPEVIKDICAQIKDKPIQVVTEGHTFPIGAIKEGELIGDTVKCQGDIFYLAPTVIKCDGKVEIMSIDLMTTPFARKRNFELLSNAPKYQVGDHVYILRRVNDSQVISSEKIKQVHAGKHSISYTLYGETVRRKQIDIFKTYEDAQRELKRGTTI